MKKRNKINIKRKKNIFLAEVIVVIILLSAFFFFPKYAGYWVWQGSSGLKIIKDKCIGIEHIPKGWLDSGPIYCSGLPLLSDNRWYCRFFWFLSFFLLVLISSIFLTIQRKNSIKNNFKK